MEKNYKKRIVFMGMPDMALVCLKKLYEKKINIVGVIPPAKTESTYKLFTDFARSLNLNIVEYDKNLSERDFLLKVRELDADLGVVASYNRKLPKELLFMTRDGFINLHPSKLPNYRGPNPYSHVIMNGEEESAITLHFVNEEFDKGDIISQYRFSVDLNETMGTLFYRTNKMCASMLFEALDYYETHKFPRKPQPQNGVFKKAEALSFEKRNIFIDWSKPAVEIERFIRALNPFIGAFTVYKGANVRINTAYVVNRPHKLKPGTIIQTKKGLRVACGKGMLDVDTIQYAGLFITSAKDFVDRVNPKKGEMFTNE